VGRSGEADNDVEAAGVDGVRTARVGGAMFPCVADVGRFCWDAGPACLAIGEQDPRDGFRVLGGGSNVGILAFPLVLEDVLVNRAWLSSEE
jgi:hypothetical protein